MDQREIFRQQRFADDRANARAVTLGKRPRGRFELGGAEIVGGRVDEIAGERDRLDDARKIAAVDAFGQLQPDLLCGLLAVAREPVRAERERKRGEPAVRGRIAEPVGPGRQQRGLPSSTSAKYLR